MDLNARVDALVDDPHCDGWRGNTTQWAKRAKRMLEDERLTAPQRRRIAGRIRDARLLHPDLAAPCPEHVPTVWDALYADVCHIVVTPCDASRVLAWLGALAYYVRHHPQMGAKRVGQIVSPGWDAVRMALCDATWGAEVHSLLTRTVLVLLLATGAAGETAEADGGGWMDHALRWLCACPPSHFCDRLLDVARDTPGFGDTLEPKRHGHAPPPPPPPSPPSPLQCHRPARKDILGHASLRLFDDRA